MHRMKGLNRPYVNLDALLVDAFLELHLLVELEEAELGFTYPLTHNR